MSAIAADAARPYGVPVDVIFADTLPPAVRSAMLKDARACQRPCGARFRRGMRDFRGGRVPGAEARAPNTAQLTLSGRSVDQVERERDVDAFVRQR